MGEAARTSHSDRYDPTDRDALVAAWEAAYGAPPPKRLRAGLLGLGVGWAEQAEAEGGYSRPLRARLDKLADALVRTGEIPTGAATPRAKLKAGTRLVREWGGAVHTVTVREDGGFEWEGERYRSLSAIAKAITGAGWSGPRFFGLDGKSAASPANAAVIDDA